MNSFNSYFAGNNPLDIDALMDFHKKNFGNTKMSIAAPEVEPQAQQVQQPPAVPTGKVFTEDDIQKARQEEKDKLYAKIEQEQQQRQAFESQVSELLAGQQQQQAADAAAAAKAKEQERIKAEEELSAKELLALRDRENQDRIAQIQAENDSRFAQLQQERETERAFLEKERALSDLKVYAQQQVSAHSDQIAPQLRDFISGNTPEEIDQSIQTVIAKSTEIAQAALEAVTTARSQQRGVSSTGYAPVGPLEVEGGQRTYSAEDIQNMSMEEYAQKVRPHLSGLAAGQNRGLYS